MECGVSRAYSVLDVECEQKEGVRAAHVCVCLVGGVSL